MAATTHTQRLIAGLAAAAVVGVGLVGVVTHGDNTEVQSLAAAPTPAFTATFDSPTDLQTLFDYGYSGIGADRSGPMTFKGDHAATSPCGGATTLRDIAFHGADLALNWSELFYQCDPTGPASGHLMTALDTLGYNIAWFSPKPTFTQITKVCWDINETTLSAGKWTQVLFVSDADAHRYPAGVLQPGSTPSYSRGTGGFDMGYTSPEFRQDAPNTQIFPQGGTLAGLKDGFGIFDWFQNQDTWTQQGVGWPGLLPQYNPGGQPITDKATRFQHCVKNADATHIQVDLDTPFGHRTYTLSGQIPQDSRRVVFEDDNYDPSKRDFYNPNVLTWHWDNIQVFTAAGPPPTTTTAAPTTTVPPTTTTTAPTTTVPPTTTTTAPTTTLPPTTTTTIPPTTTTTVPACPPSFAADAQAWCAQVNARLHALDGG